VDKEKKQLMSGAEALSLSLSETQIDQCLQFLNLMLKWNKTYNLTAVRQLSEAIDKHLLDSLSIANFISGDSVLDVGTGAGLPGIPLAIAFPEKQFTLLDANNKKIRFLRQVVIDLSLQNVRVEAARIEQFSSKEQFSDITTRAFAPLSDMLIIKAGLLTEDGKILAMKGSLSEQEKNCPPEGYTITKIHLIQVPGMDAKRSLVTLVPS
jgi:16S rRNA (guanine527-N7)-methyltransferase